MSRIDISSEEFTYKASNDPVVKDFNVVGDVLLSTASSVREITNCKIGKFTIKDLRFFSSLVKLENCIIDELDICRVNAEVFVIKGGEYKRIKVWEDKEEEIDVVGETLIRISYVNEISKFLVSKIETPFELDINKLILKKEFSVTGCSKIEDAQLNAIEGGRLEFTGNVTENLGIDSFTKNDVIKLSGVFNNVQIRKGSKLKINLDAVTVNGLMSVLLADVRSIEIDKKSSLKQLDIVSSPLSQFKMDGGSIGVLNFSAIQTQIFKLSPTTGDIVRIKEFNLNANSKSGFNILSINNLVCTNFAIRNYINDGVFEILNSEVTNRFRIDLSTLKPNDGVRSYFNSIDLQDCRQISFFKTNILGTEFFNVRWNSSHRLDNNLNLIKGADDTERINHFWLIKESYRQLKIVSLNNFNKIDANFFQLGELDVYYEILKLKIKKLRHLDDFFILWVSKVFGGYGLNIGRPLTWWCFFHSILFALIVHYAGFQFTWFNWNFDAIDLKTTRRAISLYLNLLSPVHGNEYYGRSITGILDVIIRLVAGFFIYYTIRASRKFISSL